MSELQVEANKGLSGQKQNWCDSKQTCLLEELTSNEKARGSGETVETQSGRTRRPGRREQKDAWKAR